MTEWLFFPNSLCALVSVIPLLLEQLWKLMNDPSPFPDSRDECRCISRKILQELEPANP
jgi:hypothetical protein